MQRAFVPGSIAVLLAAGSVAAQSDVEILFRVDMSIQEELGSFDPIADTVVVRGGFNAWGCSVPMEEAEPGLYELETNNLPILTTLQHWDHGFRSPFLSEIYFVNTRLFTDLKWGTRNPITCRDKDFGMVRLRAYGTYTMRVADPAKFLVEIVGTDGEFTTQEIEFQIRNLIVTHFSQIIATSGIPVLDMAGNTLELARIVHARIAPMVAEYGLELPGFMIENVSLPLHLRGWSRKEVDERASELLKLVGLDHRHVFDVPSLAELSRDAARVLEAGRLLHVQRHIERIAPATARGTDVLHERVQAGGQRERDADHENGEQGREGLLPEPAQRALTLGTRVEFQFRRRLAEARHAAPRVIP